MENSESSRVPSTATSDVGSVTAAKSTFPTFLSLSNNLSGGNSKRGLGHAGTAQLDGMGELKHVYPEEVTLDALHAYVKDYTKDAPDAANYKETLDNIIDMLAAGCGGTVIIVLHEQLITQSQTEKKRLSLSPLDSGNHTNFFRLVAKNVRTEREKFDQLLEGLTAHNESDRWEPQELEKLEEHFGKIEGASPMIKGLGGQPKDGAILVSHVGTVKAAALYMKYPSNAIQLMKHTANGISAAGTRHNSSLGFAEWLGAKGLPKCAPGVIFVRSDGGGAHAFFGKPRAGRRCLSFGKKEKELTIPKVLHFNTRSIPTQEVMLEIFKDRMLAGGDVYKKSRAVIIREAVPGETVITLVNGRVTRQQEIPNNSRQGASFVVKASTPDQELYVLPAFRVDEVYETGVSLMDVDYDRDQCCDVFLKSHREALHSKGWKLCQPKPGQERIIYKISDADLNEVPTHSFIMRDQVQRLKPDDLLAMPFPQANELYFMNKDQLKTGYTLMQTLGREEMLSLFKAQIMKEGVIDAGEGRWVYQVTTEDVKANPDVRFRARGVLFGLKADIRLAMAYPEAQATEIYVLE